MISAKAMSKPVQFTLSALVGLLGGAAVLVDAPLKIKAVCFLAMGFVVFLLRVSRPERVLLFALTFTVPFFIGKDLEGVLTRKGHIGGFSAVGLHLTDVLVVALLLLYLGRLAMGRAKIRLCPPTTVPALGWLAASALSLANARDVGVAAIQIIGMGRLFLLYLVVANSVEDEEDVQWLVTGLLLGLLSEALLGFYQGIVGRPLGLSFLGEDRVHQQSLGQGLAYRAQGTVGTPNGYAMYLVVAMSFALALLFSGAKGLYQALAGVILCAGVPSLVFSLSRGGWIGFVTVVVMTLGLAARRGRLKIHTVLLIASAACAALLVMSIVGSNLIVSRLTSEDHGSAASRVDLARGAWAMIQDHPLSGVGLNNYTLLMPQYDWTSLQSWGRPAVVHNVYLLVTAETGLVGLIAFLWFLVSSWVQAWLLVKRAPNDALWMMGVGILSACTALAVHNMVDYLLIFSWHIARQFWLLVGIAAGLSHNLGREAQEPQDSLIQAGSPVGWRTAIGT
jgi:putative inorganic carbon (HCO3(-)) transporter